ncbi:MAG TPA: hypothetical protein VFJ86_11690 [Usitatibacter sp.]|nr:hypothetical protein [Usitatibacter sp.]
MILLAILAFALAACGAIPLATIARFSGFDEQDFAALDPAALRVRVSVPEGFAVDVSQVRLAARVGFEGYARTERFDLASVGETRAVKGEGTFSRGTRVVTETLRLADRSQGGFRELQRAARASKAREIHLDVSVALRAAPKGARSVKVWIEMRLSPGEGYVTLIDGGTIALGKTEVYGTPAPQQP